MSDGSPLQGDAAPAEPTAPPADSTPDWISSLPDEAKGYIETKGFKDPSDVLNSYQELEKHMGVSEDQLIRLPSKDNPDGTMDEVWNRLGRPEESAGYEFNRPEGVEINEAMETGFREKAHEMGLTGKQAAEAYEWYNEQIMGQTEAMQHEAEAKYNEGVTELKNKWGSNYDKNVDIADRAAEALGVDADVYSSLCRELGVPRVGEMFVKIADTMGEDALTQSSGRTGWGQSSDAINHEIKAIQEAVKGDPVRWEAFQQGVGEDYMRREQLYKQLESQGGLE